MHPPLMKAVYRTQYGGPDVVGIKEIKVPETNDKELLVKIFATTVSRTDFAILLGYPRIIRLFTGISKPKSPILGTDFAGEVVKVGKGVTAFKTGDRVFGFNDQGIASQAQFMSIKECNHISIIPQNINFKQAASSLEGVHYAINFVNKVNIKEGQKALVNGATGGIGSALVQILKHYNVNVTATCPPDKMELVKSIGADKVIDFTEEDFTKDNEQYDYVFDAVGKSTFGQCKRLLHKNGVYISSELGPYIQNPFLAVFTPLLGGKKVKFPIPLNTKESICFIKVLLEKGTFKPLIDKHFTPNMIQEAYEYAGSGQKIGNVILDFIDDGV